MKEKMRYSDFFLLALCIAAGISLVLFSGEIGNAVSGSVQSCLTVIIPSLFAFMVFSSLVVKSGIYRIVPTPVSFIARYIFRLPDELFPIFILSQVGGYPVGAKLLHEMQSEGRISKHEAENMMMYCYAGGPAFIIGVLSCTYSPRAAATVYASTVIANLIIALVSALKRDIPPKNKYPEKAVISAETLVSSVYSGASSLFTVCIMIIAFSCISAILGASGALSQLTSEWENIVYTTLEISNVAHLSKSCTLPVLAALFSFGGVCVIVQIIAIIKGHFSILRFILSRIPAAVISYFTAYFSIMLFPEEVIMTAKVNVGIRSISPLPSLILIIMTILLLCKKTVAKSKTI